jgi:hypothetical protein
MPEDSAKEPFFAFMRYPRDWFAFVSAPSRFLGEIRADQRADQKRAVEYFFLGLTGAVAFSALNLSYSSWQSADNLRTLKSETVTVGVLMGSATIAIIGGIVSRLIGGKGSLRNTLVTFATVLGFLWPTMAAVLIITSRAASAILGIDWTALPPFVTSMEGHPAHTISTIAWGAFFGAVLIWTAGYFLYLYAVTFRAAQGISLRRALGVSLLATIATDWLTPWIDALAAAIGERFGPLIEWLLKIF